MRKRIVVSTMVLALTVTFCACGARNDTVSVQRAEQLAASAQTGDRFAGMVVSENVEKIKRDSSKTVLERYVSVGQTVAVGDKLFSYDSASLEIDLEKLQLEVDKMKNEQSTYASQMKELQNQLNHAGDSATKARLTLEINSLKTQLMEVDYQLEAKGKEVENLQKMLENVVITSPVDGIVREINEDEQAESYITIQQNSDFQIKGVINEMSMGSGLIPGSRVRIISRVDHTATWMGTVLRIDMEASANQSNSSAEGNLMDAMTTTTGYPFYVELDSSEGLRLGQHVYMEVAADESMGTLWIPETYLTDITTDEGTGEATAQIWVDNGQGKLESRKVILGAYDGQSGGYEVLDGLEPNTYVADPNAPGCKSGAPVSYRDASDFGVTYGEEDTQTDDGSDAAQKDTPTETSVDVTEESV